MFKHKYRIVTDSYLGYEAQIRFLYFPFCYFPVGYFQIDNINTFSSIDSAKSFIERQFVIYEKSKVVATLNKGVWDV